MVEIGSAEFILSADSARLLADLAKAEAATRRSAQAQAQAIAKASGTSVAEVKRAADRMAAEQKRIEDANRRAAESFSSGSRAAAGFAGSIVGIAGAAAAAVAAIKSIATATQEQAQAQFAINKLYGQAAPLITAQAEALAKATGRSKTEALEAAAAVANLGRQYAFSAKQQEEVLKISADLAAVRGIPIEDATKRISDALRGEAEAAEYLGQVLNNDAVKAFAKMTDEQRKNFETLSPITKAQITLGKLLGDNNDLVGAAAERANSAVGAYDKLKASVSDLGAELGKTLTPAFQSTITVIDSSVDALTRFIKKVNEVRENNARYDADQERRRQDALRRGDFRTALGLDPLADDPNRAAIAAQSAPRNSLPPGEDLPAAQQQAATATAAQVEETRRRLQRQEARERDAIRQLVEERKKAIKTVADAQEAAARAEAKRQDDDIEQERIRLNVEMEGRLNALAVRERATIRAIEAEQRAEERASQDNIERLERERDLRIETAEAARDQAAQALADEERRLDRVREIEDRATSDARQQEDRGVDDRRRTEDRERDSAQRRELQRLEDLKDARLAAIDDEIDAAEKASEKRLRAIDREAERARAASEQRIRSIERQADKEDERHRRQIQAIEDQRDAQLDALDAQLQALDAQEKQLDAAERLASLQRRVSDAERALTKAKGSGDQEALAAARQALVDAIRRGDQAAAVRARRDIDAAAGSGNPEEIEQAERDLADARAEIEKENVKTAADARREELRAAQEAIRDEADARRRAEDERNRSRKQELDADKQAEQDRLRSRLDALDKRKRAAQDATKEEIEQLRKRREEEQKDADETIRRARETFEEQARILEEQRREEDRQRDDRRQKEDRDRQDFRDAEDEKLRLQKEAIDKAYADERKAAEELYNGPNGLITQARKAQDAMKEAHRLRLEDTKLKFNEERDAIKLVYRNEAKTGLLDLQDQAAENNRNKLADQLAAIASWKDQSGEWIDENKGKWKDLGTAIDEVAAKIKNLPRSRVVTVDPDTGINSQGGVGNAPYGPGNGPGPNAPAPVAVSPGTGSGIGSPGDDAGEVNVSPDRFATSFPFLGRYTNPFNPRIPNHRGIDLVIAGARNGGKGLPVGAFRGGTVVELTNESNGGNGIILRTADGLYDRYFHFDEIHVRRGQSIRRGQQIGLLGESGTEGSPHLHYEVSRRINGDFEDEGQPLIDPRPYMRGYDTGHLFTEPTLTVGLRSGSRALIAEKRPEMLVGGAATAAAQRFNESIRLGGLGRTAAIGLPAGMPNYARIGDSLAAMRGEGGGSYADNRVINFNGSTDAETYRKFRSWDAREKALSAGRRRGPR